MWNVAYIQVITFELLAQFGVYFVNPIISNYAIILGTSLAAGGFLAGLNSLTSLFCRPLGGLVLGKASRKSLVIISAAIFMASSLICTVSDSVIILGISRVAMGVAFVVKSASVVSLAATVVPPEYAGRGVGLVGLATVMANAIGPGIGSWLGLLYGYRTAFLASTILFACDIVIAVLFKDPAKKNAVVGKDNVNDKCHQSGEYDKKSSNHDSINLPRPMKVPEFFYVKAFPAAILACLVTFVFGSAMALMILVCEQRSINGGALFFFAFAVSAFAVRAKICSVYDKHGLSKIYIPLTLLTCLSALVSLFAHSTLAVILAGMFLGIGEGSLFSCLQAESVRGVPVEKSSLAANTFYIGPDIGMAIGPLVSAAIMQAFGSEIMFLVNCIVGFIALAVYYIMSAWKKKHIYDVKAIVQHDQNT